MNIAKLRRLTKKNYAVALVLALVIFVTAMALSARFKKEDGFEMFSLAPASTATPLKLTHDDTIFATLFRKQFNTPPSYIVSPRIHSKEPATPKEVDGLVRWFRQQIEQMDHNYQVIAYKLHSVKSLPADPQTRIYIWEATIHNHHTSAHRRLRMTVSWKNNETYRMINAVQLSATSSTSQ